MASTHSPCNATCRDTRLVGVALSALLVFHLTASRTVRLPVLLTSVALCFSLFLRLLGMLSQLHGALHTACCRFAGTVCAVLGAQEQRTLAAAVAPLQLP